MADPRLYQIAVLASLLVYGMGWLDFDITVAARGAAAGDGAGHAGGRATGSTGRGRRTVKSALISGLSLCLLLRTNRPDLARPGGGRHDRRQVRHPLPRQAHLQSHQRRHRRACCC